MRCLAAFAALLLLPAAAPAPPGAPAIPTAGLSPIAVTVQAVPLDPADPSADRVGRLRFWGGLAIASVDPRFGGVSGLRWWNNGLLGVTDGGSWLHLRLDEDGDRLSGVARAAMGMIRGPGREPLRGRGHVDAEALDLDPGGGMSIAFDRDRRIWSYRNLADAAWSVDFPDRRWIDSLPHGGGISAMAGAAGWRLFLAEGPTGDGRQEGLLAATRGLDRTFARVTVPVEPGLRPTDAQALDAGHIVLLSRRYSPVRGEVDVALDIVPVDAQALTLGAAEPLARLTTPLTVDNMEGLALRRDGDRLFLYLIADDNFSPLQRTLLLKFEVMR